jgi:hypothetical protein
VTSPIGMSKIVSSRVVGFEPSSCCKKSSQKTSKNPGTQLASATRRRAARPTMIRGARRRFRSRTVLSSPAPRMTRNPRARETRLRRPETRRRNPRTEAGERLAIKRLSRLMRSRHPGMAVRRAKTQAIATMRARHERMAAGATDRRVPRRPPPRSGNVPRPTLTSRARKPKTTSVRTAANRTPRRRLTIGAATPTSREGQRSTGAAVMV